MSALKQSYGNGFWEVGPEFGFLPKSAPLARLPAAASARSARTLPPISRLLHRLPPHYADLQTLMDDLPIWKNLDCGEHGILAHEVMGAGSSSCCPRALNAFCCRAPSWTASPPCPIFLKEYARPPSPCFTIHLAQVEAEHDVFVQAALFRALTFAASAYLLEPSHHEQKRSGT
jgi:hypothetical protein